jgi:hypothetical protein
VAFLDQDDLWHPTRLERLLAWCDEHPDEPVVATTELVFDTTDERDELMTDHPLIAEWTSHHVAPARALDELVAAADTTGSDEVEVADLARMLRGPISATTSFLARPRTLQLAGGCAPHAPALDDYWMLVNVARMRPFPKIDQPTTFYRVHLGATSRTTRLALPFLSSAVALRLGGGLLPISDGLHTDTAGELHEHLLDELLRSAQADDHTVRRAARHLAALLWADGHRGALVRAEARRRLPDPAVDAIRRVRGRRL